MRSLEQAADVTRAQADAQAANLLALRAQLAQQSAAALNSRSYVLRAPFDGKVAAITTRAGQPAMSQQPIVSIVPDGSQLRAELAVPSKAIGFVKIGQEVRIAIDAFPYQRFGTLKGRIVAISESAIILGRGGPEAKAIYPVVVELESQHVAAFGSEYTLVPDMTLTARIVTDNQTLLEWLFEPLFAVRKR